MKDSPSPLQTQWEGADSQSTPTALREWGLGVQDNKVAEKVLSQRLKIISNSEDI